MGPNPYAAQHMPQEAYNPAAQYFQNHLSGLNPNSQYQRQMQQIRQEQTQPSQTVFAMQVANVQEANATKIDPLHTVFFYNKREDQIYAKYLDSMGNLVFRLFMPAEFPQEAPQAPQLNVAQYQLQIQELQERIDNLEKTRDNIQSYRSQIQGMQSRTESLEKMMEEVLANVTKPNESLATTADGSQRKQSSSSAADVPTNGL